MEANLVLTTTSTSFINSGRRLMHELLILLLLLMRCAGKWGSAAKVRVASVMAVVVEAVLLQCVFVLVVLWRLLL